VSSCENAGKTDAFTNGRGYGQPEIIDRKKSFRRFRAIQSYIAKDLKADEVSRKEVVAEQTCLPLARRLLKIDAELF
jgi:hypothetical protein